MTFASEKFRNILIIVLGPQWIWLLALPCSSGYLIAVTVIVEIEKAVQ